MWKSYAVAFIFVVVVACTGDGTQGLVRDSTTW
jgi:hypothetical protein